MKEIRSILVASDFSDSAELAVQRAGALAGQFTARLELLHVMSASALGALRQILPTALDAEAKLVADARQMLDGQAARLTAIDQAAITKRVTVGHIIDEILAACKAAGLLVLGARGLNPVRDMILGTTASRLLRKSTLPVLTVKQAVRGPYKHVIVPVDFSPHSVRALTTALDVAPGAKISVIHAYDLPFEGKLWLAGVDENEINRYRLQAHQQSLSKIGGLLQGLNGDPARFHRIVDRGDASQVILAAEEKLGADLIVIGKHGQSVVEDFLLGSVTRHVLSDSKCDVLVVQEPR